MHNCPAAQQLPPPPPCILPCSHPCSQACSWYWTGERGRESGHLGGRPPSLPIVGTATVTLISGPKPLGGADDDGEPMKQVVVFRGPNTQFKLAGRFHPLGGPSLQILLGAQRKDKAFKVTVRGCTLQVSNWVDSAFEALPENESESASENESASAIQP